MSITWEYGYSGEIIIYVNDKRYCTVDTYREYKQVRKELLDQNLLLV